MPEKKKKKSGGEISNQTVMKASLFRVNSVPSHRSVLPALPDLHPSRPSSGASASSSSSGIAARISLRLANGRRGGGSSSRGSVPRAPSENGAIPRRSSPGDSTATGDRGGCGKRSEIGDYYREMLESSPNCSLLLRNYAKYLHEVNAESETVKTELARFDSSSVI